MRRIKNRKGFSLAETLLAVLILLLVSAIVASGVPVARNVFNRVIIGSNAQLLLSTTVQALRDELGTAWDVKVSADGKAITYFNADAGVRAQISLDEDEEDEDGKKKIKVTKFNALSDYTLDDSDDIDEEIVDWYDLVSEATSSDGMYVVYDDSSAITYDDERKVVIFPKLTVFNKNDEELASLENLTVRVFSTGTSTISQPDPTAAASGT